MCIIMAKKRGALVPPHIEALLQSGAFGNRDGGGFAIKRSGTKKIEVIKGLFQVDDMLKAFRDLSVKSADEFIAHFRVRTSGATDSSMTHPFVITKNVNDISTISSSNITDPVLFHNGMFSEFSGYRRKSTTIDGSDTYWFVRDFLNTYNPKIGNRKLNKWRKRFTKIVSYNKLAIMYPDQDMELLGKFHYDYGMFFSNGGYTGWESFKNSTTRYSPRSPHVAGFREYND